MYEPQSRPRIGDCLDLLRAPCSVATVHLSSFNILLFRFASHLPDSVLSFLTPFLALRVSDHLLPQLLSLPSPSFLGGLLGTPYPKFQAGYRRRRALLVSCPFDAFISLSDQLYIDRGRLLRFGRRCGAVFTTFYPGRGDEDERHARR